MNPEFQKPTVSDSLDKLTGSLFDFAPSRELWSEVVPGLFVGGTSDTATMNLRGYDTELKRGLFDTVVTLYAAANPVDWYVKELRFGFYDDDKVDVDRDDLRQLVRVAHEDLLRQKRVLVRCQAGLNRSGLVAALILIRHGFSAVEAIELIRTKRGANALFNSAFRDWLRSQDVEFWRA